MTHKPGDWVADRETLAEAAADPSLSNGAVRALCLICVGEITAEDRAWAIAVLSLPSPPHKETETP